MIFAKFRKVSNLEVCNYRHINLYVLHIQFRVLIEN